MSPTVGAGVADRLRDVNDVVASGSHTNGGREAL